MEIKAIPTKALTFAVSDVQIGDNGDNAKTAPVKMVARSGQPIDHWYWGRVVHDLAGMKLNKPRIPVDYCHDDEEVIGYLNKFDTSTGDLVVSGALVPYTPNPDDMATEVIYKSHAGVPYEASINFGGDGIIVEEVAAGASVKVNGYQFQGPGVVIRQWPLRGVAICPYGADSNTKTELSEKDQTKVNFISGVTPMSEQVKPVEAAPAAVEPAKIETKPQPTSEAAPAAAVELSVSTEAKPAPASVEAPKTGKDFIAAFGTQGAVWFAEGKTYEQATMLNDALKPLQSEIEQLKTQISELSAKKPGSIGNQPATFSPPATEKTKLIKLPRNA